MRERLVAVGRGGYAGSDGAVDAAGAGRTEGAGRLVGATRPESAARPGSAARSTSSVHANRLVEENIPLVGYAVSEMHHRYPMVERDELVSAGLEGLVLASRSWDPDAGTQFSTWAHAKIRWSIQEFLQQLDWMGRRGRDKAKRLVKAREQLTHSLGREPADAELATALGVSVDELASMTAAASQSQIPMDDSLNDMLSATEDGPEKRLLDAEKNLLLHKAVQSLPERTRRVVELHYFQGLAQGEVAERLEVSDATVSKEKKRGLALLREALGTALHVRPAEPVAASVPAAGREEFLAAAGRAMRGGIVTPMRRYA